MGLIHDYFNETRKPEGTLGSIMIAGMNFGHSFVPDWVSRIFLKKESPML